MKKLIFLMAFSLGMLMSCEKDSPFYDEGDLNTSSQSETNIIPDDPITQVHPSILQSDWWTSMSESAQELVAIELNSQDQAVTYSDLQKLRRENLRLWQNTERAGTVSPGYPLPNPEGDVLLTSQAEVDDFGSHGYKHILGQLMINDDGVADQICDLSLLSDLRSVGSLCFILSVSCANDLHGLHNLKTVGLIGPLGAFAVQGDNLKDISALNSLKTITGSLNIVDNPNLKNINGFSKIKTIGPGQTSATIQSSYVLQVRFNGVLKNMDGLSNLREVGGRFILEGNSVLRNVDDLSKIKKIGYWTGRDISFRFAQINDNPNLKNLDGLKNLRSVGGTLSIFDNNTLKNLNGLSKLSFVGENLEVINNPDLNKFCGLYKVLSVGVPGMITILGNATNPTVADILTDGPCS